jgi:tetratricopeptide (TPR) repeat protein
MAVKFLALLLSVWLGSHMAPALQALEADAGSLQIILPSAQEQFEQAINLHEVGNVQAEELFLQAAIGFERQAQNNPLYWYHAGTAYWWAGRYPQAIAALRRQALIDPFNAHLWDNLAAARAGAGTANPGDLGPRDWPWLLWIALGLAVGLVFLGLLVGIGYWTRQGHYFKLAKGAGGLVLLLLTLMLGAWSLSPRYGVLLQASHSYLGDSTAYATFPKEPWKAGQELRILESRHRWLRIRVGQTEAWVPAAAVDLLGLDL